MSADTIIVTAGLAAIIWFLQQIHTQLKAISLMIREDDWQQNS